MTEKQLSIEKILEWLDKNTKYEYYTDDKFRKHKEDLFKHKVFNCSDKVEE